jgi:hypothetical protein
LHLREEGACGEEEGCDGEEGFGGHGGSVGAGGKVWKVVGGRKCGDAGKWGD